MNIRVYCESIINIYIYQTARKYYFVTYYQNIENFCVKHSNLDAAQCVKFCKQKMYYFLKLQECK